MSSNPWKSPGVLWGFWDMVTVLGFWITCRQQIQDIRLVIQKYPAGRPLEPGDARFVINNLYGFGQACAQLQCATALVPLGYLIRVYDFDKKLGEHDFSKLTLAGGPDLLNRLNQFEENLYRETMLRFVLAIPEDRLNYFTGFAHFGGFPSAMEDIDEAGKCYATARYRATVFHVIRACEWALKSLAKAAGVRGRLDYKEWGKIIKGIEEKVAAIDKWKTGPAKSNALAFYRGALADARALNNVWRTTNLHVKPGVSCDQNDAKKALDRGLDFMTTVAARTNESQSKALTKRSFEDDKAC